MVLIFLFIIVRTSSKGSVTTVSCFQSSIFHTRTDLSSDCDAIYLPERKFEEKIIWNQLKLTSSKNLGDSQGRLPIGSQEMPLTNPVWPFKTATDSGIFNIFQILIVLSTDEDAKYWSSGDQSRSKTSPLWPLNVETQRQCSTFVFPPPPNMVLPIKSTI